MKNFLFAVATLVGAIVGLGMFGIPYTAANAGFFVTAFYIVVLGIVTLLLHLMYGEIVERGKEKHRLTGTVEKYFGAKWRRVMGSVIVYSIYASMLAYIVVAGKFLALIFPDIASEFAFGIIFWALISVGVFVGIRTIAEIELLMTALLVVFVGLVWGQGWGNIQFENFYNFDFSHAFMPYGVVLFAFAGIFAIPEIKEVIKVDGKEYKKAIMWGTLLPIPLYLAFLFLVLGVSGAGTSEEALAGLSSHLGPGIVLLGAIFGLLAISTTYLVLGSNLKHTMEYDLRWGKIPSRILPVLPPLVLFLILFLADVNSFIGVISFSGAVFGAIISVFVILIYKRAKERGDKEPGYKLNLSKAVMWGIMALLILGGLYEIIYLFA
jgi:tyrosine-specific transport protein